MKYIVCFHLLNDYSGSPKALCQTLNSLLSEGYRIDLITSKGGVLDSLQGDEKLRIYHCNYRFSRYRIVTAWRYGCAQLYTFLFAFKYLFKKDVTFYINTLLPVGPALAGRLMRKKVIYHYHENSFIKGAVYRGLSWAMQRLASRIICVSSYQRVFLKRERDIVIMPNLLPEEFREAFEEVESRRLPEVPMILMLSSLKRYKGIFEFIELARNIPHYRFCMVISDTYAHIEAFFSKQQIGIPENLTIFDRQEDIIPFYKEASLVLNLSNKEFVIETFGLTVLEAMTAAIPVIVPTVGGVAEMVEDGINGYKIDVTDLDKIEEQLNHILSDDELYHRLSYNAKLCAKSYSVETLKSHFIRFNS